LTLLLDILRELRGMFLADLRLALAVLGLIALVGVLTGALGLAPLAGGVLLALGAVAIVVASVLAAARPR
jgi:hypothetical protein